MATDIGYMNFKRKYEEAYRAGYTESARSILRKWSMTLACESGDSLFDSTRRAKVKDLIYNTDLFVDNMKRRYG